MTRFFNWLRLRRFHKVVRQLRRNMETPLDRVQALTLLCEYLQKSTFTRALSPAERALTHRSYALTCDNLLLDLGDALDRIEKHASFENFPYSRRILQTVKWDDFLSSNSRKDIPPALFARKLLPLIGSFVVRIKELQATESKYLDHHLRQTSRLIDEVITVQYRLIAVSDQKLTPPVS